MAKFNGGIQCVNDGNAVHNIEDDDLNGLCGKADYCLKRNYYGKKNKIIWRSIEGVTCDKCKDEYLKRKMK